MNIDNIEEQNDSDSSTIEIKPKKERKKAEYVYTDARKEAFEKATQIREMRRNERKLNKQLDEANKQKSLNEKIIKKADVIKKKQIKQEKMLNVSDQSDDEPEIVIKRRPKKKKIIIVESESDDDDVVVKRRNKTIKQLPTPTPLIKKYVPVYY